MDWARTNGYIVLPHDLDFGMLLATTHAQGPSVIQARTQNIPPAQPDSPFARLITSALRKFEPQLETGALIVINESRARVRILPLNP